MLPTEKVTTKLPWRTTTSLQALVRMQTSRISLQVWHWCGPSPKIPKKLSLHSKLKGAAQQFLKVSGRQRSGVCLKMDMGDTTNNPNMVNSIGKVMTNWKRMAGV